MKIVPVIIASTLTGAALPALAQLATKAQPRGEVEANARARYHALDTNKDGFVTRDEIGAARWEKGGAVGAQDRLPMAMQDGTGTTIGAIGDRGRLPIEAMVKAIMLRFDAADANKDGVLSPQERAAARAARPAGMPG